MSSKYTKVSAASAAAQLVRRRVAQGQMSREDGIAFSNWIDRQVKLNLLPDDPNMLGLVESGEWKIASGTRPVDVGRVVGVGEEGVVTRIYRNPRRKE